MRRRGLRAVPVVCALALALVVPAANAADSLKMYRVTVDERGAGTLGALDDEWLQRMIGVIYRPETERWSHYVSARPAAQFDLLAHVDETTALEPLERWSADEAPADTYPSGL